MEHALLKIHKANYRLNNRKKLFNPNKTALEKRVELETDLLRYITADERISDYNQVLICTQAVTLTLSKPNKDGSFLIIKGFPSDSESLQSKSNKTSSVIVKGEIITQTNPPPNPSLETTSKSPRTKKIPKFTQSQVLIDGMSSFVIDFVNQESISLIWSEKLGTFLLY